MVTTYLLRILRLVLRILTLGNIIYSLYWFDIAATRTSALPTSTLLLDLLALLDLVAESDGLCVRACFAGRGLGRSESRLGLDSRQGLGRTSLGRCDLGAFGSSD